MTALDRVAALDDLDGAPRGLRFAVESWSPDYGSPVGDEALEPAASEVDASVEVPIDEWAPIAAPPGSSRIGELLFVDGVRRVEAHVWITAADGQVHQGICASYAAGAMGCDGSARLVSAQVERRLLTAAPDAAAIVTHHGSFALSRPAAGDGADLSQELQKLMGALEARVVHEAGIPDDAHEPTDQGAVARAAEVAVIDGPLKRGQIDRALVGYVKTHRAAYGPAAVRDTITRLAVGERTPVLRLAGIFPRYTWYHRLPCPVSHGWAGIVRLEATADQDIADVAHLADRLSLTLGRYASAEQKDPRAPQNLYPIGGLERELRRRLGDPALIYRALRRAAAFPI